MSQEINFDGLVGPTHNYGGLSRGNLASDKNRGRASNPRGAALQGLEKMRKLIGLGLTQGLLPPQERPFIPGLRAVGYTGTDGQILEKAFQDSPALVANMSAASSMWTANAATVSAGSQTSDGRVHLTPANLVAMPHRALEAEQTHHTLSAIFKDTNHFNVHAPLPANSLFGDEGAANHNRLASGHGAKGLELFVYGRDALRGQSGLKFPARQTLQASEAVARLHGLSDGETLFVRQSAEAINAGAFHNDVVCVTNDNVLFFHEAAFEDTALLEKQVLAKGNTLGFKPVFLMAKRDALPLQDVISSYLFNSQLITLPNGDMNLILPIETEETASAKAFVDECLAGDNPITAAHYMDLRQSMSNGGGPACLRLRVQANASQQAGIHGGVMMTPAKIDALENWVRQHYRDRLIADDLGDAAFLQETREALDALTQLLDLGSLYDFQR
ncbi:N-succinylarginine dihydrolase [Litorimonas sp. RW-G-Af-16]|uniref:N-succinylarginine dihydrolase n=1 Tax=Litorimonas sp. RW-G-Af-16 TaxID=3241168 RepID=UPI003AAD808C